MATTVLYTPEVLALATSLAAYPWDDALPLKGEARSRSCGSTIALGMDTDPDGRIGRVALKSSACAIGQAAAAIFARAATGRNAQEIQTAERAIASWLAGDSDLPDWPGLDAIAAARDYPARHGAIMLAWQAARDLLSTD
jgi:NifU-like protein involved in Fe-S cluster formation